MNPEVDRLGKYLHCSFLDCEIFPAILNVLADRWFHIATQTGLNLDLYPRGRDKPPNRQNRRQRTESLLRAYQPVDEVGASLIR
jgi:hypothetical protein